MAPNQPTDASAVTFTREYLMAFEQELVEAKGGAGLIEAMKGNIPKQDPKPRSQTKIPNQVSALRLRSVPRLPRAR